MRHDLSKGSFPQDLEIGEVLGPDGRPPQVDLVPARYIFFANVPVKMREKLDKSDI